MAYHEGQEGQGEGPKLRMYVPEFKTIKNAPNRAQSDSPVGFLTVGVPSDQPGNTAFHGATTRQMYSCHK